MAFWVWLPSLTLMFSTSNHGVAWISTSFLSMVEYYSIVQLAIPHFVYLLISWWTFGLFPPWNHYESCCNGHSCASFCVNMFSLPLGIYLGVELLDHMVTPYLTFWGTAHFSIYVFFYSYNQGKNTILYLSCNTLSIVLIWSVSSTLFKISSLL